MTFSRIKEVNASLVDLLILSAEKLARCYRWILVHRQRGQTEFRANTSACDRKYMNTFNSNIMSQRYRLNLFVTLCEDDLIKCIIPTHRNVISDWKLSSSYTRSIRAPASVPAPTSESEWDSSCSQEQEGQQSSFRAHISKIEQFLHNERLRLPKRPRTDD